MKKGFKIFGLFITIGLVIFAGLYVLLGMYYTDGFPCFTWINGVYCTGMTVEQVNAELVAQYKCEDFVIKGTDGEELVISPEDVNLKVDFTGPLRDFIDNSNPYAWGLNVFKNLVIQYEPDITYDRSLLLDKVAAWEIFEEKEIPNVTIVKGNGYELHDAYNLVPNKENILNAVNIAYDTHKTTLDLSETEGCYEELQLSEQDLRTIALFDKLDEVQSCGISYSVMGEEIPVNKEQVSKWILTDKDLEVALEEEYDKKTPGMGLFIAGNREIMDLEEEGVLAEDGFLFDYDGNLIISERKMYEFLKGIEETYDTSRFLANYKNGTGTEVFYRDNSRGNGSLIEIDEEFEYLKAAFLADTKSASVKREISMADGVKSFDAAKELGQTYIEVDMGKQELRYYVDGQLNMEMPVVTGNINRGRGTPTGVYNIYNKRYHTYLRGADYVSYVNYWLGVHKGVGIHDANWRNKFGEEIYKRDGSHGCINCPESQVSQLWEVVEVGTPVVLYY
ncbi:L,D-transpeptidase [Butyrivibrio sp. AE3009]|uniref:L,D-transpeptidase n=1 Tax=Butyrivibrio sp. AE3009 TaxID=1280666 RepID=UPI0003B48129|nr:L,D-transpeptidase [Butyrivibrio sp. AE3009]